MNFDALVEAVRTSPVGKFYFAYLRRYALARWAARQFWRFLIPVYLRIYYWYTQPVAMRALGKIADEPARKLGSSVFYETGTVMLAQPETLDTPPPGIFPEKARAALVAPHAQYRFPAITVMMLPRAIVHGNSNFVTVGESMVHHDLYDFARDYTVEEMHGRAAIDLKNGQIRWYAKEEMLEPIERAASFVDGIAANYAHWMTEVLPRIAMFVADARYDGLPIIINDGLHPNLMESLALVAPAREIICLGKNQAVPVNTLYSVSPTGYVPFDWRKRKITNPSHGVFSPKALQQLRTQLLATVRDRQLPATPRRLYLKRTSAARTIPTQTAINTLMEELGFTNVAPETLSFAEQIVLFRDAEIIVAQSGAALANIIFCKPGTPIIVLNTSFPGTLYWYWQNIACATGNRVTFVLGKPLQHINSHGDFAIDPEDLRRAIMEIQKTSS